MHYGAHIHVERQTLSNSLLVLKRRLTHVLLFVPFAMSKNLGIIRLLLLMLTVQLFYETWTEPADCAIL